MLELDSIFIPLCNRQTRLYRREIWQGNNSTPLLCECGALPASPLPMYEIFVSGQKIRAGQTWVPHDSTTSLCELVMRLSLPFIITSVKWDSKNCHLLGSKEYEGSSEQ